MAKVLIVDDAAFMRLTIREALEAAGHEVVGEAANGFEAVKGYQQYRPDIVTMDITMPDMDGVTGVRKIKELDPQAIIIMCSAMGQQRKVFEAVEAGAKDFIVKPFHADRLVQAVNNQILA
ncbi:response regulator [Paenibacillus sp. sgz500958]|uniref:response regulator n=1 Tax=Paenibacillus sp. sgz500958 TaxID=3242475 RepID=UPI0036D3D2F4